MQRADGRLVYSATDLVGYLECAHLANLERAAVWGHLTRPWDGKTSCGPPILMMQAS